MKRFVVVRGLLVCVFALIVTPVSAIVTRHDVPDPKYLELATEVPSPVTLLTNKLGSADGMGTWIAPDWLLTAAHVGEQIAVGDSIGPAQQYQVLEVVLHDDWPNAPIDVALIKTSGAGGDINTVDLCPADELGGRTAVFAGAGDSGDGKTGPVRADGKMRAARNVISSVAEHFVTFVFDGPGSAAETELEGISGPGDSGGPAYLATESGYCIFAVSSGQDTEATGGLEGRYGVVEYYSRVDVLRDWIRSVTASSNPSRR